MCQKRPTEEVCALKSKIMTPGTKQPLMYQKRRTKETYKRDLRKRPTKETYERDLQNGLTKKTYQKDLQKRPTKETYKRDLPKRPTKETYKRGQQNIKRNLQRFAKEACALTSEAVTPGTKIEPCKRDIHMSKETYKLTCHKRHWCVKRDVQIDVLNDTSLMCQKETYKRGRWNIKRDL